jgi:hypothetical protein
MKRQKTSMLAAAAITITLTAAWAWTELRPGAEAFTLLERTSNSWYGPIGISANDTAIFSYSNFAPAGTEPVMIEWQFSDALTGENIRGNYGDPRAVKPGEGIVWTLGGTRTDVPGADVALASRRQIVGWLSVTYADSRAKRRAVDLAGIEIVDNETARTTSIVMANPLAPGGKYAQPAPER